MGTFPAKRAAVILELQSALRSELKNMAMRRGLRVLATGARAESVLKSLEENEQSCDLIISALELADANAVQVLKAMRQPGSPWAKTHLLVIFQDQHLTNIEDMLPLGLSGFLRRPFTVDQFNAFIKTFLSVEAFYSGRTELIYKLTAGNYYELQGDFDRAATAFAEIAQARPSGSIMLSLGRVLLQQGDTKGVEILKRAVEMSPELKPQVRQLLDKNARSAFFQSIPQLALDLCGVPQRILGERFYGQKNLESLLIVNRSWEESSGIRSMFKSLGFKTALQCKSGREVVKIIEENSVNLVFLATELADMNGLQLIDLLRRDTRNSAVRLMLYLEPEFSENLQQAFELGLDGFVFKPMSRQTLVSSLHSMMLNDDLAAASGPARPKLKAASAFQDLGDLRRALDLAQQIVSDQPQDAFAHLCVASMHQKLLEPKQAQQHYEQAVQLDARFASPARRLQKLIDAVQKRSGASVAVPHVRSDSQSDDQTRASADPASDAGETFGPNKDMDQNDAERLNSGSNFDEKLQLKTREIPADARPEIDESLVLKAAAPAKSQKGEFGFVNVDWLDPASFANLPVANLSEPATAQGNDSARELLALVVDLALTALTVLRQFQLVAPRLLVGEDAPTPTLAQKDLLRAIAEIIGMSELRRQLGLAAATEAKVTVWVRQVNKSPFDEYLREQLGRFIIEVGYHDRMLQRLQDFWTPERLQGRGLDDVAFSEAHLIRALTLAAANLHRFLQPVHRDFFNGRQRFHVRSDQLAVELHARRNVEDWQEIEDLLRMDSYSLSAFMKLSLLLKKTGCTQEAEKLYARHGIRYARHPKTARSLARFFEKQADFDKAYEILLELSKRDLDDRQLAFDAAVAALKAQKFTACAKLCSKQLYKNPDDFETLNLMGIAFRKMGKVEKAIELYQKGIAINPNCAKLFVNLGIAYYALGNREAALAAHKRARELSGSESNGPDQGPPQVA